MKLFALFLLAACAPLHNIDALYAGTPERVVGWDMCLDVFMCPRFLPFYRVGSDPNHESVFWYVSEQGHACPIFPGQYDAHPNTGQMLTCNWRLARP